MKHLLMSGHHASTCANRLSSVEVPFVSIEKEPVIPFHPRLISSAI
jgi:hypothetical protein